ncbi:MAG: hypothetical protein HKN33_08145 [Pyrinomonadaceae bacterium]|nr:hypothetical protein [Pyrinomonadaceae bacterium]
MIRTVVEQPEDVMGSTLLTKSDIGRSLLEKIDSANSPKDLKKIAENVLPKIEKFLETPEEKQLRRIRTGSLVSLIGLGVSIGCVLAAIFEDPEIIKGAIAGFVTMFVGVAMLINGYYFSVPKKNLLERTGSSDDQPPALHKETNELLMPPKAKSQFSSVTENTTRTLDDKVPIADKREQN